MADAYLDALRSCVARMHDPAANASDDGLSGRVDPSEWGIGDVLPHLASGAALLAAATAERRDALPATFDPSGDTAPPDLDLPAEAFGGLVHGRLDGGHAPGGDHGAAFDVLRRVFAGP